MRSERSLAPLSELGDRYLKYILSWYILEFSFIFELGMNWVMLVVLLSDYGH